MNATIKAGNHPANPVRLEVWHDDEPHKVAVWNVPSWRAAWTQIKLLELQSGQMFTVETIDGKNLK